MSAGLGGTLERWFYWLGALAIIAIVALGFSFTIERNLLHPGSARPLILYVHAAVFTAWVLLLLAQSTLVRASRVRIHRRLGEFGIGLGTALPVIGVWTAIAMARFHVRHGNPHAAAFLIVPMTDMAMFATLFAAAVLQRGRPEWHRRLMFVATCALTGAAFGRLPESFIAQEWYYGGVELLVLAGLARDLASMRRVHPAYLYTLPLLICGHVFSTLTYLREPPWWMDIANRLAG